MKNRWSDRLSSTTTLSYVSFANRRVGDLNDMEKYVANVTDIRETEQFGVQQDWTYNPSDTHLMQWGITFLNGDAKYDYNGQAAYFLLQALYEDVTNPVSRVLTATPSGASYALYFADRRELSPKTVIEWGLRWDDQTYTDIPSDSQLSPRISLLRSLGENTEIRLSWGRYYQSQGIHELQIEDGIDNFWRAQSADHYIAGLKHNFSNSLSLRVEAFYKDMDNVRPRFENLYDPLGLIPELQPDRVRLDPSGASSRGIEISLNAERGSWSWWGSYTLSEVTDRIDGVDVVRSWDQRHAVQGGLSWSKDGWDLACAAGAHTGWPTTDLTLEQYGTDINGDPIYVAVPGTRNALRHDAFASLDFRLSRRFNVPRGSLTAFVEVSNLTNRKNTCCIDWDVMFDQNGTPALDSSLDYWLPLLPAIGILWEF